MTFMKTKDRELDWRLLPEVVKVQNDLDLMEQRFPDLKDRMVSLKGKAEGEAAHCEELDLDCRIDRVTKEQLASAKAGAEKTVDEYKQAKAELRKLEFDIVQQRKAWDRVRMDGMRRVARALCQSQAEDARLKSAAVLRAVEIEERMTKRMHSAQAQFRGDDPIRSAAGINNAGGVGRLSYSGLQRGRLEQFRAKLEAFEAQLKNSQEVA